MQSQYSRRHFLSTVGAVVGASGAVVGAAGATLAATAAPPGAAGATPGDSAAGTARPAAREMTIQDVIDLIIDEIPGAPIDESVDTFKSGDPSRPVTGIVSTFLATSDVIESAAALGANLIITHEPTYYNHLDTTDWLPDDPVYAHKRRLLDEHGIAVWRFHDYWHLVQPDGILTGFLKKLGWEEYPISDGDRRDLPSTLEIPPTTVAELAAHCKDRLKIDHPLQLVGDPEMACRKVGLSLGAYGGRGQIEFLRRSEVDVLLVGEINEWETSVYVKDARSMGRATSLLMLGHANSEEPGMEFLVDWLQPLVPDVPVHHVPGGDPFVLV